MKTIRRAFLALTLAMALSAGATAAETVAFDFTDWNEVDYQSSVSILTSLGVVGGYADNSFRPNNYITRAEIAKIAAYLREETVPEYTTSSFTDTETTWAGDYIEYCAEQGILVGYNGRFRPNDYVTVRELTKVLLVVLGQDSSNYVGNQWAENVDADAEELGIYDSDTGDRNVYATRQQACQLISNALQCPVLVEQENGDVVYVLDNMMTPMTLLQYRFNVIPVEGVVEANAQADLRDNTPLEGNLIHIAGYSKDFRVLEEVANDMSLLGRPVTVYARFFTDENRVYGVPTVRSSGYAAEDLQPAELEVILQKGELDFTSATSYYLNYVKTDSSLLNDLQSDDRITLLDYQADDIVDRVLVSRPIPDPCPEEGEEATQAPE